MPVIDFNAAMSQAKNASFEPLPDGNYNLVCLEATASESQTGKPMIKAKYQVEDGPNQGKKVWNNYTFSADNDNALAFFFQHMGFHGLDHSFFAQNPAWETVASSLQGRRIQVTLGQREFQGTIRNDVKKIMPPSGATPAPQAAPQPQQQVAPPQQPAPQVQVPVQEVAPQPAPQPVVQEQPQPQVVQQPAPQQVPQQPQVVAPQQVPVQPQQPVEQVPVQQPVEAVQQPVEATQQPVAQPQQDPAAPPEVPF